MSTQDTAKASTPRKRLSIDQRLEKTKIKLENLQATRIARDRKRRTRELIMLGTLVAQMVAGDDKLKDHFRDLAKTVNLAIDPLVEAAFARADADRAKRLAAEAEATARKLKKAEALSAPGSAAGVPAQPDPARETSQQGPSDRPAERRSTTMPPRADSYSDEEVRRAEEAWALEQARLRALAAEPHRPPSGT